MSKKNEVTIKIDEFKNLFNNPKRELEDGTWFTKVLNKMIGESKNLTADYFSKKYVGLDKDNIAKKLIKNTSVNVAIAGGIAGAAITGLELAAIPTLGTSLLGVGTTIIGEFAAITYFQLKLIYELSVLYDSKLDPEDPEDLISIFWYTLGINKWEEASRTILKAGPRVTNFLGRKTLRSLKITKILQSTAKKLGGKELAKKITEKGLLKFLVPGVNIIAAASLNKIFTMQLGKQAIKTFKNRSLAISSLEQLSKFDRSYQLLVVPLIFHVGIDGVNKAAKTIEMQNTSFKYLKTTEDENEVINDLVLIEKEEFCILLSQINDEKVRHLLGYIAVLSHLLSNEKTNTSLKLILESLNIQFTNEYLERIKKKTA